VDPVTARDLDDALSITEVSKDVFEVGVHIADVSHFVNPDAMVDLEAQWRTTSVYLVHRVIPMLPRVLCENLCSLNPDVERLAFSVFFYIRRNGEVLWD
jgi:exoribonuclease R